MENLTRENAVEVKFNGRTLDECIDSLIKYRQEGKSVYIDYNGQKLYSCDATVNNIYTQLFGKTREEYERDEQEFLAGLEQKKVEPKEQTEKSISEWVEAGQKLIYPEKTSQWEKMVGIRANDTSGENDLGFAITAMEMLNGGTSFENVRSYINGLNTSKGTLSMIESTILNFSKKGPDFFEFMRGRTRKYR